MAHWTDRTHRTKGVNNGWKRRVFIEMCKACDTADFHIYEFGICGHRYTEESELPVYFPGLTLNQAFSIWGCLCSEELTDEQVLFVGNTAGISIECLASISGIPKETIKDMIEKEEQKWIAPNRL